MLALILNMEYQSDATSGRNRPRDGEPEIFENPSSENWCYLSLDPSTDLGLMSHPSNSPFSKWAVASGIMSYLLGHANWLVHIANSLVKWAVIFSRLVKNLRFSRFSDMTGTFSTIRGKECSIKLRAYCTYVARITILTYFHELAIHNWSEDVSIHRIKRRINTKKKWWVK
jgi:hypothetical protein